MEKGTTNASIFHKVNHAKLLKLEYAKFTTPSPSKKLNARKCNPIFS
jgi:hypothetical protein